MELQQWHWLVLGLILIGIETLGAGGFLVGIAIASFIMAVVAHVADVVWEWQLISFAVLSIISTAVFWLFFKKKQQVDTRLINDRAAQMIGRTFVLKTPITAPQDKIQIGDTYWKVESKQNFAAGDKVRVCASQGMTLLIERAEY